MNQLSGKDYRRLHHTSRDTLLGWNTAVNGCIDAPLALHPQIPD
ncbi:MAG: hypothetical protein VKL39_03095 [Leptolyngbyaceae bacterium]|nr:hypothetical protein [Leptolyngbyaceae bacterium]